MPYLLDSGTLVEVLRAAPAPALVRRLRSVPTADRWTSAISVGQLLVAARADASPKLMQVVVRLVAAVKVAPFDLGAAQVFAKLRAGSASDAEVDDVMIAAVALANDFTLVTRRPKTFAAFPRLRIEDWTT